MNQKFIDTAGLPFCKGCGHNFVVTNMEKALEELNKYNPLDIVLVTDIGCQGIIDKKFNTHTVHGLHGRSAALALGISLGLDNPKKKIICFLGDGGATIGMQHLIEAAHKNINMTVVIFNNMLYGMTGGQPSGLTPKGFKTAILPKGKPEEGYDFCSLAENVGANYVQRVLGMGDFSGTLLEALKTEGFALVEVLELCTSYTIKFNPGFNLKNYAEEIGLPIKLYCKKNNPPFKMEEREYKESLITDKIAIPIEFKSDLKEPFSIVLSGSAGEAVQSAAEFFSQAAIASGLHTTKKGSYPVTVGVGFSSSEIIVSPEEILYTGIYEPDAVIIISQDGLNYSKKRIEEMTKGVLYIDESLESPNTKAKIIKYDFRGYAGVKTACLYALFKLLKEHKIFPIDALIQTIKNSKLGDKIDIEKLIK
ncbi:MAG: thiamine pyrophosphate-dependent enzyme [bacterium]|nr:thiamine pyrophosphate-dependent enzyme [bacterium]